MLVLSRKKNEQIVIDEEIVVTVIDIRGDKVRLGIKAPPKVPVHRMEVAEKLAEEGRTHLESRPDPEQAA